MFVSRDKETLENMTTLIQQHLCADDDGVDAKVSDPKPFKFVAIPSISEHTATVILFHGLGGSSDCLRHIAALLRKDPALNHVEWILPRAPTRPIAGNFGMETRAWFDVHSFDIANRTEDVTGIASAAKSVEALIETEVEFGIAPERVILVGFSQGAALVAWTALTTPLRKVGGVALLSGYIPQRRTIKEAISPHSSSIPVFWGHGTDDSQVDHEFSRSCAATLASDLGIPFRVHSGGHEVGAMEGLDFHSYEGLGHAFNNDELNDLKTWIKGLIPGPSNRNSVGSLEACTAKFPGKFV